MAFAHAGHTDPGPTDERMVARLIVLGDVELLELCHAAIASARVALSSASRKSATKLM